MMNLSAGAKLALAIALGAVCLHPLVKKAGTLETNRRAPDLPAHPSTASSHQGSGFESSPELPGSESPHLRSRGGHLAALKDQEELAGLSDEELMAELVRLLETGAGGAEYPPVSVAP